MASCTLSLTPVNGELRIYDLHLAERLGFSQAFDIRKIIKRYADKLLNFGVLATVAKTSGALGGRPTAEYYLNQKQAIFVCMKSETDKAADVQVEIVHVFDAYLNGQLVPQPQPDPQPRLTTEQQRVIDSLIHGISICCKFHGRANSAAHERIRFSFGLRLSSDLHPQDFDAAKADLEGLRELAEQHLHRLCTLDEEFITAVIRPPVSIRKVRAMARKAVSQPLSF
ncbi:MAG: hypothetical protein ABTR07_17595 [Candidatus Competibacter denitrificans]